MLLSNIAAMWDTSATACAILPLVTQTNVPFTLSLSQDTVSSRQVCVAV